MFDWNFKILTLLAWVHKSGVSTHFLNGAKREPNALRFNVLDVRKDDEQNPLRDTLKFIGRSVCLSLIDVSRRSREIYIAMRIHLSFNSQESRINLARCEKRSRRIFSIVFYLSGPARSAEQIVIIRISNKQTIWLDNCIWRGINGIFRNKIRLNK